MSFNMTYIPSIFCKLGVRFRVLISYGIFPLSTTLYNVPVRPIALHLKKNNVLFPSLLVMQRLISGFRSCQPDPSIKSFTTNVSY